MSPVATPLTAPLLVVQHLGGGEARVDLDAQRFRLLPRASGTRCRGSRCSCRGCSSAAATASSACGYALSRVRIRNRSSVTGVVDRRAARLPVGEELVQRARIDHRARQDVRADLRALLEHADGHLALLLGGELLQADRRGEARRAAADDRPRRTPSLRGSSGVSPRVRRRAQAGGSVIIIAAGLASSRMTPARRTSIPSTRRPADPLGRHGRARPRQQHRLLPLHGAGAHRVAVRAARRRRRHAASGPVIVNASCNFLVPLVYPGERRGPDVPRRARAHRASAASTRSSADGTQVRRRRGQDRLDRLRDRAADAAARAHRRAAARDSRSDDER